MQPAISLPSFARAGASRVAAFSCLLAGAAAAVPVVAEEWPEFRGPGQQGHSARSNLPVEWDSRKNVDWKTTIPGKGWSSPVRSGDTLYLTTAVEQADGSLSLRALAIAARDGSERWNREVFRESAEAVARIHQKNSNASPTPIVEDARLYVHFGHMGTACLDLDGAKLWENRSLRYSPVHGNGGCPAIVGDRLVFSCDGGSTPFIVALDKHTGDVAWKQTRATDARKTFSFSTPLAIEIGGRTQLVTPGSNVVSALDPSDGSEIWRVRYDGYSVIPRPIFAHGLVFIGTGYDNPTVMAIRPDGRGDVTESHVAWTTGRRAPNTPSLLVVGDELYMVSDGGIASCLDARTGAVHWEERACGPISASPLHANGLIYLQDERGKGVVLRAGKTFEIVAENDLGERTLASYAVGDGCLFIRTEDNLYRIGGK